MKTQIITHSVSGSLHFAGDFVNRMGLADFLVHIDAPGHSASIIILRVPADEAPKVRRAIGAYLPQYIENQPLYDTAYRP